MIPSAPHHHAIVAGSALCLAILATCAVVAADDPPLVPIRLALVPLVVATAFVLDEPAAAAVDAVPRSRRRRTGQRVTAVVVPAVAWVAGVAAVEFRAPSTPAIGLVVEGVGVVACTMALAAVLRVAGWAEPGEVVASSVGATILGLLVLDPPLWWPAPPFPVATGWAGSTAVWAALTVVSSAVVVGASRDPYRSVRAPFSR